MRVRSFLTGVALLAIVSAVLLASCQPAAPAGTGDQAGAEPGATEVPEATVSAIVQASAGARPGTYDYDAFTAYLPPEVESFNGILFIASGSDGDTRPYATGDSDLPEELAIHDLAVALARSHGLAVMGATPLSGHRVNYDQLLAAADAIAAASERPELAAAPFMVVGYSLGACFAEGFGRDHPERTAGLIMMKGICVTQPDPDPAGQVPAYLIIGELDRPSRTTPISNLFEANRSDGALWAEAIEPGAGHDPIQDPNLLFHWMDVILGLRLPDAEETTALRPLDESSGWLGDRTTYTIAPFACYEGDPLTASWFPTEELAREWQVFVSDGQVDAVTSCD